MAKVKSIKKIGTNVPQKCIRINNPDGLFVLENKLITHNSPEYIMRLYNDSKGRVWSRMKGNYYGRALDYEEEIITSEGNKKIKDVEIGDNVLTPSGFSQIDCIPFDDEDDLYEIELEDGRTIKCNLNHLWPVSIDDIKTLIKTELLLSFTNVYFFDIKRSLIKFKKIQKIGRSKQKCIHLNDGVGEFYLSNKILTHNSILDSSPNQLGNAIDDYIVNDARKDRSNYIVEGSVWKWSPDDYKKEFENGEVFKVYTGGKGNPPKILEEGDPLLTSKNTADSTKIIEVPLSLKQLFVDDLVKAIKDQAGIPSGSADNLIYDYKPLEKMFDNNLRNLYSHIEAPATEDPYQLIWGQVKDLFFKYKAGRYEFYYKPWCPRCIAVDQSYATDTTAIACTHVERFEDSGELIHVVDFTIVIVPTKDAHVNLEAVRCFIEDLRNLGNLRIEHVGFDQFQSETTIQNLQRSGFEVEKVSTDKSMDPYLNMVAMINRGRIASGKNLYLKNNIKSLHVSKTKTGKPKIDHDNSRPGVTTGDDSWDKGVLGMYAKDCSDAVADAMELNRKHFLISEETWDGGPKITADIYEKEKALDDLNKFLRNFGLK